MDGTPVVAIVELWIDSLEWEHAFECLEKGWRVQVRIDDSRFGWTNSRMRLSYLIAQIFRGNGGGYSRHVRAGPEYARIKANANPKLLCYIVGPWCCLAARGISLVSAAFSATGLWMFQIPIASRGLATEKSAHLVSIYTQYFTKIPIQLVNCRLESVFR